VFAYAHCSVAQIAEFESTQTLKQQMPKGVLKDFLNSRQFAQAQPCQLA
jgi:hypothetical protein